MVQSWVNDADEGLAVEQAIAFQMTFLNEEKQLRMTALKINA